MFFRRKKKDQPQRGEAAPPTPGEARKRYRRSPGKNHALGVSLRLPGAEPISGSIVDLSAGGAAVLFRHDRDPELAVGRTGQLVFSSLLHGGEIVVDCAVASVRGSPDTGRRYGFRFSGVEELFAQLDSYYFNFFNRRRRVRVRPALDTRLPVTLRLASGSFEAPASDLSVHGLGFMVNRSKADELSAAKGVDIEFKIPKTQEAVAVRARVVHVTELTRGVLAGLEFDPADATAFEDQRQRLDAYARAREEDMARWDSAY